MAKAYVTALVGAGGKSTVMYEMAARAAASGKKVLVTTTTHIWKPEQGYASDLEEVCALWGEGRYAVVGTEEAGTGKLVGVPPEEWRAYLGVADVILVEADGAKGLPCKAPAEHEPVLPAECSKVIAVAGMDAVGMPGREACFRWEIARQELGVSEEHILRPIDIALLLVSERGQRKAVGERDYMILLNKCDAEERLDYACAIHGILVNAGFDMKKIGFRGGALDGR